MRGGPGERTDGGGSDQILAPLLPPVRSAKNTGLVPAGKRPQQRNPAPMAEKWNPSHGENRNVPVCGSAHDPEKKTRSSWEFLTINT